MPTVDLYNLWQTTVPEEWRNFLSSIPTSTYFPILAEKIREASKEEEILPSTDLIFNAFIQTPLDKVSVVILGQDPYPNPAYPNGLAFSVRSGNKTPGSLLNIFRELNSDLGGPLRKNTDLSDWSQQGVLLLNSSLTVNAGKPGSHVDFGWLSFTDSVISLLSQNKPNLVYFLWGYYAIHREQLIHPTDNLLVRSSHPSMLSYLKRCGIYPAFKGSKPFSRANQYLEQKKKKEINWLGS